MLLTRCEGNERPCKECTKRGIELACVDGVRKPPKYLGDTASLRHTRSSLWAARHEFIDPTMLHTWRLNSGSEDHACMRLSRGRRNKALGSSGTLQHSPWADVQPSECHGITQKIPQQPTEDVSGNVCPETLEIGTLMPPGSNINSYGEHANGYVQRSGASYGFTISSGWSSTFFPCGIDEEPEEPEEPKVMAMAVRGAECADVGGREGNKASRLL